MTHIITKHLQVPAGPLRIMKGSLAESGELVAAAQRVFAWMDEPQPKGALTNHLGIHCQRTWFDSVRLSAMYVTHEGGRGLHFELVDEKAGELLRAIAHADPAEVDLGFTALDAAQVIQLAKKIGPDAKTIDVWGCSQWISVRWFMLMGQGAATLLANYDRGCVEHGGTVFCECGWFKRGYAKARLPDGWK